MNKILTLLALISFTSGVAQNVWQKSFSNPSFAFSIIKATSDSGYILAGSKYSISGDEDIFLVKLNASGDTVWTKSYVNPGNDWVNEVIQTFDGGYCTVGSFMLKTDSIGNPVWSRFFFGSCVMELPNGDLTAIGGLSGPTFLIAKFDSSGTTLFAKTYPYPFTINFFQYMIKSTSDGGYIIAGETNYSISTTDACLIKSDSLGNIVWMHAYGGNSHDYFQDVEVTNDGGFLAMGRTGYNGEIFLVKADTSGTLLWAKSSIPNTDIEAYSMCKTHDNNFVLTGVKSSPGNNAAPVWKIDSTGSLLWVNAYIPQAGSIACGFTSVEETLDHGLILGGYGILASLSDGYLYAVKTDSMGNSNNCNQGSLSFAISTITSKDSSFMFTGSSTTLLSTVITSGCFCDTVMTLCTGTGVSENPSFALGNLFPNPFTDELNLHLESAQPVEVYLFDITSRKIIQKKFVSSTVINTRQLAKGVYIYEVRDKNGLCKKGKVVKD